MNYLTKEKFNKYLYNVSKSGHGGYDDERWYDFIYAASLENNNGTIIDEMEASFRSLGGFSDKRIESSRIYLEEGMRLIQHCKEKHLI